MKKLFKKVLGEIKHLLGYSKYSKRHYMSEQMNQLIVREFKLDSFTPEKQQKYIERISVLVANEIVTRALLTLDNQGKSEFLDLLEDEGQKPEEVLSFLQGRIKNYKRMLGEAVETVRNQYKKQLLSA